MISSSLRSVQEVTSRNPHFAELCPQSTKYFNNNLQNSKVAKLHFARLLENRKIRLEEDRRLDSRLWGTDDPAFSLICVIEKGYTLIWFMK